MEIQNQLFFPSGPTERTIRHHRLFAGDIKVLVIKTVDWILAHDLAVRGMQGKGSTRLMARLTIV
jgi:hypothetical protein